jgi:long-chain acyl-CoA synthetase
MSERVVAVIQLADRSDAGPVLAAELQTSIRARLSGVKVPRPLDFDVRLPRDDTGKLYKRLLRDRCWTH